MKYKFRAKLDVSKEELSAEELAEIIDEYAGYKMPCPVDKNGWVYGNAIDGETPFIVGEVVESFCYEGINVKYWYPVKKVTVGQYTGLKDKNGTEIYDGDLLNWTDSKNDRPLIVLWNNCLSSWGLKVSENSKPRPAFSYDFDELEIVGNIHDNPELIEV